MNVEPGSGASGSSPNAEPWSSLADSFDRAKAERVEGWDVLRDSAGRPVTISGDQFEAIWHALMVVEDVRRSEGYRSLWDNPQAEIYKSRLLGRMLFEGLPPTRTKPPTGWGPGPVWSQLPGGDPFAPGTCRATGPASPCSQLSPNTQTTLLLPRALTKGDLPHA